MTSAPQLTEEDIDRWERLFRHKFPETKFGPPNEWPAIIALARKGLRAEQNPREGIGCASDRPVIGEEKAGPPQSPATSGDHCPFCGNDAPPPQGPDELPDEQIWKPGGGSYTAAPAPLDGRLSSNQPSEGSSPSGSATHLCDCPAPVEGFRKVGGRLVADLEGGTPMIVPTPKACPDCERMAGLLADEQEYSAEAKDTIAALRSALEKVQECRDLYEAIEVTRAALGTPPKG